MKVIFICLPLAVIVILFLKHKINIPVITQKNFTDVIENNIRYVGGTLIGYVLYIGILDGVRKAILYVGRGGFINDMRKAPTATAAPQQQQQDNTGRGILRLIIILLIIGASYNQSGSYKKYSGNGK